MQKRIEGIQRRQALIPQVKQLQKELVILRMQLTKLEERPLDSQCIDKRNELSAKSDELRELQTVYRKLADKELDILKVNLETINRQINSSGIYDLDLEDHRTSLEQSIHTLKDEICQVMGDNSMTGFRGKASTSLTNENNTTEHD